MSYTDSHCHLYDTRGVAVDDVIAAARAAGVTTMINVGCDAATTEQAIEVAASHDDIFATAGLHPHEAKHGVDTIVPYIDDPNIVAIGECGLDYFYDHSPRAEQRVAFAAQIQLAHQRSLPLVIHTRDAWAETFDILDAEGMPERSIFHCFTGGPDEARQCLARGAYLSFSGIVTFKTATDLHDAARLCPMDRLLAETDSPYLAPVPHRGRAEPTGVRHPRGASTRTICGAPRSTTCAQLRWRTHALRFQVFIRSLFPVPRTEIPTMNPYDRRRLALASIFTVAALPALWIINRNDPDSAAPSLGAAGVPEVGANQAPSTSAYTPDAPIFLNGPPSGADPAVVDIIIPPGPTATEATGRASFRRYDDGTKHPCTTALAPWGSHLTVTNTDNGQYHNLRQQPQHAVARRGRHRVAHRRLRDDQRPRRRARFRCASAGKACTLATTLVHC